MSVMRFTSRKGKAIMTSQVTPNSADENRQTIRPATLRPIPKANRAQWKAGSTQLTRETQAEAETNNLNDISATVEGDMFKVPKLKTDDQLSWVDEHTHEIGTALHESGTAHWPDSSIFDRVARSNGVSESDLPIDTIPEGIAPNANDDELDLSKVIVTRENRDDIIPSLNELRPQRGKRSTAPQPSAMFQTLRNSRIHPTPVVRPNIQPQVTHVDIDNIPSDPDELLKWYNNQNPLSAFNTSTHTALEQREMPTRRALADTLGKKEASNPSTEPSIPAVENKVTAPVINPTNWLDELAQPTNDTYDIQIDVPSIEIPSIDAPSIEENAPVVQPIASTTEALFTPLLTGISVQTEFNNGDVVGLATIYGERIQAIKTSAEARDALADLKELIQYFPEIPQFYRLIGDIYTKQGKLEKAIMIYQKSFDLSQNSLHDVTTHV